MQETTEAACVAAGDGCVWGPAASAAAQAPGAGQAPRRRALRQQRRLQDAPPAGSAAAVADVTPADLRIAAALAGQCNHRDWLAILQSPVQVRGTPALAAARTQPSCQPAGWRGLACMGLAHRRVCWVVAVRALEGAHNGYRTLVPWIFRPPTTEA